MLLNMQISNGKPFLIKFIASETGQVRIIARCMMGGQKRAFFATHINKSGIERKISSIKETGRLPVIDMDCKEGAQFRTPFISHIIQFNNYQIKH